MSQFSRYDQKLEHILRTSARIFAEKSYHSTSMRDISRATGVSLAGLYHYCKSKEELLFLIQDHCFGRLRDRLEERIKQVDDPFEKLHIFIDNHLSFFAANMAEMKVLSHEAESLAGDMHAHVSTKKEKYAKLARKILREIQEQQPATSRVDLTVAAYALFGMMNWIYNWYDPSGKLAVTDLVDIIVQIFLNGFMGNSKRKLAGAWKWKRSENANVWRGGVKTMLAILLLGVALLRPAIGAAQEARSKPQLPCLGSPVYGGNTKYEEISQEPRPGIKAEGYPKGANKKPAPREMLTVFLVVFKGVEYHVFVDADQIIQRITTSDHHFKTPEGVAVGDTATSVKPLAQATPANPCGYSLELASGWIVDFGSNSEAANGSLSDDATVKSFSMRLRSKKSH
ncbi:MAG TPA: TetR/AcrR family transcriptional regulator [Pyrinomonadaceae bacterium]|nr:TetR/AcrR family transcriptional regulator [Pyrinomonadaceae bacterium]